MADIYEFLGTHEVLIYILLAIGCLFGIRWLWRALTEWRLARYSLEKEFALRRLGRAIAALMLILLLFCAEMFAASFIVPGLPASSLVPTMTLDVLSTPTGTISAQLATVLALTPAPVPPASGEEGCVANQVDISTPKSGAVIQGTVEIQGTVNFPDFGFYKYEVALAGTENWATISAGRDKVVGGPL